MSKSQEIDEALITSNKRHREERLNMKADDHHELAEISVTKTEKIVSVIRYDYVYCLLSGVKPCSISSGNLGSY